MDVPLLVARACERDDGFGRRRVRAQVVSGARHLAHCSCAVPFSPIAPGPGRSATPSTAAFPVAGMQNTAARCALCPAPSPRLPPAWPVSLMHWAPVWPKAPALFWPGQKIPLAAVIVTVPLVSGVRLTGSGAWKPARFGRHWIVVSCVPTGVHAAPVSGLIVFVFVFQLGSHAPERHFGQGEAVLPLMK